MLDDSRAHWAKKYWGDDYLDDPNCFYRMLIIGVLTAHLNLTYDTSNLPLLRQLVNDLAADIDGSPVGLVDDYPEQYFPADVGVAIAIIRHADTARGTDRSDWAKNALERLIHSCCGSLPACMALSESGQPTGPNRVCTNGFFSFIRNIEPEVAARLYSEYVAGFWQENIGCAGWREFPRDPGATKARAIAIPTPVRWWQDSGPAPRASVWARRDSMVTMRVPACLGRN